MTRGARMSVRGVRIQSSSADTCCRRNALNSRHEAKSCVVKQPSSWLTTSAKSLQSRQNARRTLITCTAMNILLSTSTLESSAVC